MLNSKVKALMITSSAKDSLNIEVQDEYTPEKYKAIGGSIFLGYGMLNGNIANYITDPFSLELTLIFIGKEWLYKLMTI